MAYIEEKMYESDIDIKGTLKRLYGLGAKKTQSKLDKSRK